MKIGKWARLILAAAPLLAGCGNFWQAPSGGSGSSSFSLTNSASITVAPGAATNNTSTISVTPSSSFTGTVSLSCAITTSPSNATSPTTCSLSPTSLTFSSDTAQTSTLTAATTATTTTGSYEVTVTGTSGTTSETTDVCVLVTTSSGNCSSAAAASGVLYVLNQATNQIVALTAASSGSVNTVGANNLPVAANPTFEPAAIAVGNPNGNYGNFLYVSTINGIYLYNIGNGGSLTVGYGGLPIAPFPYVANSMQVDSTNSWLVFTVSGLGQIYALAINSSTGLPSVAGEQPATFPLPASATPLQLAISPNDSSSCNNCYVFVAMGNGGTEAVHFNPANANPYGGSGTIHLVNSSGGDNAVAVDPTNRLLYIGETAAVSGAQTGGLRALTIAGNGVTDISGSPYSSQGTGPSSIQPSADGNFVYIANEAVSGSTSDNIAGFSVSVGSTSATSSLTYIATATAGPAGRISLAEDSTGTYLFAADDSGGPDLQAYTMSSGTLTSLLTGNFGASAAGSYAIAALP